MLIERGMRILRISGIFKYDRSPTRIQASVISVDPSFLKQEITETAYSVIIQCATENKRFPILINKQ